MPKCSVTLTFEKQRITRHYSNELQIQMPHIQEFLTRLHIHSFVFLTPLWWKVVLLRIPNLQPNPRILPESVRVRIRESFAAVSDGFGSSVCESIFTYQVTAFKRRVWLPVPPCGRLNGCVAAAPPPAVWSVTSRISQLQIII